MKQKVPLTICFIMGIVMLCQYFMPFTEGFNRRTVQWLLIVAGFALCLGLYSLVRVHILKIRRKASGWGYSWVTIIGLIWMLSVGFIWGREEGTPFLHTFFLIIVPIQATMFSLLAFFIASSCSLISSRKLFMRCGDMSLGM